MELGVGWLASMEGSMSTKDAEAFQATWYGRDHGAVCLEFPLLGPSGITPMEFIEELAVGTLQWTWTSETRAGTSRQRPGVPDILSQDTTSRLIADLSERDADGYGNFVALFGAVSLPDEISPPWLRSELTRLVNDIEGDLVIALIQLDDQASMLAFYRPTPSIEVARLLEHWRTGRSMAKRRKYSDLRTAQLENLFKL